MKFFGIIGAIVLFCNMAQARLVIDTGKTRTSPSTYTLDVDKAGTELAYSHYTVEISQDVLEGIGYSVGEFQNLITQAKLSEDVEVVLFMAVPRATGAITVKIYNIGIQVKHM